jgi:hypothetical protein
MMMSVPRQSPIFVIWALLIFIAPARADTVPLPDGWRLPAAGELDAAWRGDDPERYLRAAGDFDGDGETDLAVVMIAEQIGPRGFPSAIGVFAVLSQASGGQDFHPVRILEHPLPVDFPQFGIAARPPGRYVTACGAGYGDGCAPGEPEAVDLAHAGIECCLFESVTGIFWWNQDTGRFDGVPVSD